MLEDGAIISADESTSPMVEVWAICASELLEIRTFYQIEGPAQLWAGRLQGNFHHWTGMVSVREYAKRHIIDCELDQS
jgi:hypothetical protein